MSDWTLPDSTEEVKIRVQCMNESCAFMSRELEKGANHADKSEHKVVAETTRRLTWNENVTE